MASSHPDPKCPDGAELGQGLSPVIKLTESCNLSCSYCYQQGELKPGQWMRPELLERICLELAKNCRPPVPVLWYGGEPTLIGLRAFSQALDCAQRYLGHLQLEHSLQTNGLLLDAFWADLLAHRKVRVRLSLDGPAHLHDRARPRANGGRSHARVMHSLRLLQSYGLNPRVACTVTRASLGRAGELVRYFADLGLEEVDFSPALSLGSPAKTSRAWVGGREFGDFLVEALEAWFQIPYTRLKIRSLAALIRKFHGLSPGYCKLEGNCSRFITFGWDGSVYPCDEFSRTVSLGNVEDQSLEQILRSRPVDPPLPADSPCQGCRWEFTCPGSLCPFERAMSDNGRASVLCEGWRVLQQHLYDRGWAPAALSPGAKN